MWEQYRKTALMMQITILAICLGMLFILKWPLPPVLATFVIMQFAALAGAWWGLRLRKRIEKSIEKSATELPLNRKKR